MKIPKLNLGILPNYHGKSNKSLNQSMLETYEKKYKIPTYNLWFINLEYVVFLFLYSINKAYINRK